MIDYLASMQFAQGMMIALAARERTGRGQVVDSNLLNAAVTSHLQEGTTYLNTGQQFPRPTDGSRACAQHRPLRLLPGRRRPVVALDRRVLRRRAVEAHGAGLRAAPVGASTTRGSRPSTVCASTPRRLTDSSPTRSRSHPRDEIMARFEAEDVLVAPVHDYDAVFTDPQVAAQRAGARGRGRRRRPGQVRGHADRSCPRPRRASAHVPPTVGQHNDEVLAAAG